MRSLALVLLLSTVLTAQTPPSFFGYEIVITMDADALSGWTCDWDDIVLVDTAGQEETIDFLHGLTTIPNVLWTPTTSGVGLFASLYPHGSYVYEPFWISQAFGSLGGVLDVQFQPIPGMIPPLVDAYQRVVGFAPQHRRGLRIARQDGQPFWLKSLDYRNAVTNFEIGTSLVNYGSSASFTPVTPLLGTTTWETLTFQPLDPDVATVKLAGGGAGLVFDPATSTVTASGIVLQLEQTDGMVLDQPAQDPLVYGSVAFTADYVGSDVTGLTDITLANATLTLTASGGAHQLTIATSFPTNVVHDRLEGVPPVYPQRYRALVSAGAPANTTLGSGSSVLSIIAGRLALDDVALILRATPQGPRLVDIVKSFDPRLDFRMASTPQGGFVYGIVGLAPGREIWSVFDVNPTGAVGTGPLFGLPFAALQLQQLFLPLGAHPIHVVADAHGTYFFGIPALGTLAGATLDLLLLERTSPTLTSHPILRVTL